MKNYVPFKLVTWDDYDDDIERAKEHIEKHGFVLWRLGVNIEHPLIAVKKSNSKEIVAIMVSKGCIKKSELMPMIEKRGNNWHFKEGEYKDKPIMPQEWINVDLGNMEDNNTWYLIVTKIIDDLKIDESAVYSIDEKSGLKLNKNWNQNSWVYLRICG